MVRLALAVLAATGGLLVVVAPARAVPAFAQQTGQPCTACHIGAFGPQLTPFGRAFKIGGYTQNGGQGTAAQIPLAATVLGSFTRTNAAQPAPAATHFATNDNLAIDQISIFLAGRASDWAGGFVQGTFSGIDKTIHLDNTDLRPFTTAIPVQDTDLRVGFSVNNNPTVQDPYNSTFAWGYPFANSALAPTPAAQPALAGALALNSVGVTAYAWYDRRIYLEAGGYETMGPTLLSATGNALGAAPYGATRNIAPYLRGAYEWDWNGQSAHLGGIFFNSNFNPATGSFRADGSSGHNDYTDLALDGGYQFLGDGTHVFTAEGIYTHEWQNLRAAFNTGGAAQPHDSLDQIRLTLTYYYRQTYGLTLALQDTWGNADRLLYAPAPLTGSANGKPNNTAFLVEADWVPFGKADSVLAPFVNLKLGVQYVAYTRFNGGTGNYDGFGRSASGNNTLYAFAWLAF